LAVSLEFTTVGTISVSLSRFHLLLEFFIILTLFLFLFSLLVAYFNVILHCNVQRIFEET
jgi:hypothetical protein